ncbi:uncharacterized protein LOC141900991 isoform X3 [Tubulanus polymorphus]
MEIVSKSKGYFNAEQAAWLLQSIPIPQHKLGAIRILEPRLCHMTCDEARLILATFTIHNDKLVALNHIKRVLSDCQTQLGLEYIMSAFPFEQDKLKAASILKTVRSDAADRLSAGGHQGYGALGGLYTQSRPLVPHLYGPLELQFRQSPGHGAIEIPPQAQAGVVPSIYTGHPSYAYPKDKSYIETRGYPGAPSFLDEDDYVRFLPYSGGAPPLGYHSGQPNPVGFPNLEATY